MHLESLNNHRKREQQLRVAADVLAPHANSVLVGDFNFDSARNFCEIGEAGSPGGGAAQTLENDSLGAILPGHDDVWPLLHPDAAGAPGFTFDARRNPLVTNKLEVMRYDRVMARFTRGPANGDGNGDGDGNDENDAPRQKAAAAKPKRKKSSGFWPFRRSSSSSSNREGKEQDREGKRDDGEGKCAEGKAADDADGPRWRAEAIELVGTEALAATGAAAGVAGGLRPSDHFGLFTRFELA